MHKLWEVSCISKIKDMTEVDMFCWGTNVCKIYGILCKKMLYFIIYPLIDEESIQEWGNLPMLCKNF